MKPTQQRNKNNTDLIRKLNLVRGSIWFGWICLLFAFVRYKLWMVYILDKLHRYLLLVDKYKSYGISLYKILLEYADPCNSCELCVPILPHNQFFPSNRVHINLKSQCFVATEIDKPKGNFLCSPNLTTLENLHLWLFSKWMKNLRNDDE